MTTNRIKATVINLKQGVPKSGGSPWLMISEKAAAAVLSSERPGMVAGSAQSLVGPKVSAGPSVALAAPATGAAIINTVKGMSLVWNQQLNPGASYTNQSVTFTFDNGRITANGTSSGTSTASFFNLFPSIIVGHKYYLRYHGSHSGFALRETITSGTAIEFSASKVLTAGAAGGIQWKPAAEGGAVTADFYLELIDLTKMFGSGNEPATAAEFDALFPDDYYDYNSGTLLPLRISGLVSKDADDAELATISMPVVGKTATDGDGNPIVPFPTGVNGDGTTNDEYGRDGGTLRWGVRAYEAGDESDATVITDGTNTAYPLDTPVPFTWDEPLEMVAPVAEGGVLFLQPEGVDERGIPKTAPLAAEIKWPVNAVSADTLTNLLDALKTAGVITDYTMTWDAAAGAYTFTIS